MFEVLGILLIWSKICLHNLRTAPEKMLRVLNFPDFEIWAKHETLSEIKPPLLHCTTYIVFSRSRRCGLRGENQTKPAKAGTVAVLMICKLSFDAEIQALLGWAFSHPHGLRTLINRKHGQGTHSTEMGAINRPKIPKIYLPRLFA